MPSTNTAQVSTPSDREIRIERAFSAPRRLVYDACTKPELVQRWLGNMPGWTWAKCEMEVRVGGRYHWIWKGPHDAALGISGTYREIVPQQRLVNTEQFDEAWYAGEALDTVVFTESDGRTMVTTTILYVSREVRDGALQSPMAEGMEQGYKALEALLDAESKG